MDEEGACLAIFFLNTIHRKDEMYDEVITASENHDLQKFEKTLGYVSTDA